ncbi:MAG: HU family DNA-binding protein [Gammaproteobacteria bacterium]|nr:HU family DNA-binding protein [Gammaproteobacteria bacterium]
MPGRSPQTGEPVAIAASRIPSFQPAKATRNAVNEEQGGPARCPPFVPPAPS